MSKIAAAPLPLSKHATASNHLRALHSADPRTGLTEEVTIDLLEGANATQSAYDGLTAFHLAACEGREEVVKLLLSVGCDLKQRYRWGNTARDDAVRETRDRVVSLLSPEAKAEFKPIERKAA